MPYGRKRSRSAVVYRRVAKRAKTTAKGYLRTVRARNVLRKYVRRRANQRALIPRKLGLMQPPRILVKLRHVLSRTMMFAATNNEAASPTVFLPMRLRDINTAIEPENYPEDFVNYARLYESYCVYAVKISAWLYQASDTPNDHFVSVFYTVPSESAAAADPYPLASGANDLKKDEFMSKKGIRKKLMMGSGVSHSRSQFHNGGYFSMERIMQQKINYDMRAATGQVTQTGAKVADPIFAPTIFHKLVDPQVGGGHAGGGSTIQVRYTVTSYCMFFNRRRDLGVTIGGDADEDV